MDMWKGGEAADEIKIIVGVVRDFFQTPSFYT